MEGCASVGAWTYSVTGSKEDTVTLRLRTEGAEHPDAALYQDGRWSRVEGELDGSYLVFQAPVQGQVMLLDQRALPVLAVALCGGGVLALLLALVSHPPPAAEKVAGQLLPSQRTSPSPWADLYTAPNRKQEDCRHGSPPVSFTPRSQAAGRLPSGEGRSWLPPADSPALSDW